MSEHRNTRRGRFARTSGIADAEHAAKPARAGRLARSTAMFSAATGLSRVAGLVREIVAASYFGITAQMSAFTIAFQVPNLVRSLFADAAIQAAFVPVFTEQLEQGNRREAFRLASSLIFLVTAILGALTALFILLAPVIMPLFVPDEYVDVADLTVSLSRILFPIIVLLGVTGMVVGILNSFDRFGAYAIAPFFWNVVIIAVLVGLAPAFPEEDEIYAYAIGVLAGTIVQLAICFWDLKNTPYGLRRAFDALFSFSRADWHDSNVRRILVLMLPVTISLGLININLLINSSIGFLVSEQAPAAIDKAFRIYMLPQGIFSVAIATVLFPTLARYAARSDFDRLRSTMANGTRQILLLLVPGRRIDPGSRRAHDPPRLPARRLRRAASTDLVSEALFWFAFSLPFSGVFLLQTRTFFSLQRPWVPTLVGAANLVITAVVASSSTTRTAIGGIVAATSLATIVSVLVGGAILHRALGPARARLSSSGRARGSSPRRRPACRRLLLHLGRAGRGARAAAWAARSSRSASPWRRARSSYGVALTLLRVPEMGQVLSLRRRGQP